MSARIVACGGPRCGLPHAALRREAPESLEISRHCLGPCDHAAVVVVRPEGREDRPAWLAFVAEDAARDVAEWVAVGGPIPPILDLHRFVPARSGQSQ